MLHKILLEDKISGCPLAIRRCAYVESQLTRTALDMRASTRTMIFVSRSFQTFGGCEPAHKSVKTPTFQEKCLSSPDVPQQECCIYFSLVAKLEFMECEYRQMNMLVIVAVAGDDCR